MWIYDSRVLDKSTKDFLSISINVGSTNMTMNELLDKADEKNFAPASDLKDYFNFL